MLKDYALKTSLNISYVRYGAYCKNDVKLTYDLFKIISKDFPLEELKLIDITLKMYISPTLTLDNDLLAKRLVDVKEAKTKLLTSMMDKLEVEQ